MNKIHFSEKFEHRHNGPTPKETAQMLQSLGLESFDQLIDQTVPAQIRTNRPLDLPPALSEAAYLQKMARIADGNKVFKSYIGQGYYDVVLPGVILRNVFENPGWYTQYTPYQAEIAQGRLQALLNFQTVVIDLTGMEVANASLLDEATAAAEAMFMQYGIRKNKDADTYFVSDNTFPQTLDVLRTRASSYGINLQIGDIRQVPDTEKLFGVMVQYPAANGELVAYKELATRMHERGATVCAVADLLSLSLLESPGEWGADVVVGSSQRFGVPMGFGGPHAGYFATKETYKRNIPGRIIGVTIDAE